MDTLAQTLKPLGLSDKQLTVYQALIEAGTASAHRLSKKTGIKRTTTYSLLGDLISLGLVSLVPNNSTNIYRALSPEFALEKRYKDIQRARKLIPEIEVQLTAGAKEEKPRVLYFQGVEGIKNLTQHRREELAGDTLNGFWATTTKEVLDQFGNFFHEYSRDLEKMNTLERGISPDTPEVAEYNERYHSDVSDLVEKKILPASIYNPQVSFEFSGTWLKIYDFTNLHGLIIESENAAEAMRQIFELAWLGASNNIFSLKEGEELRYTFTSLSSLDAFWKETVQSLRTRFPKEPIYFQEPHEFWIYLTPRGESQPRFMRSFKEQRAFMAIGGNTKLDQKYSDTFASENLKIIHIAKEKIPRNKTFAIIKSYVIESYISEDTAHVIDLMFENGSAPEEIGSYLSGVRSPETEISLTIAHDENRAEKLRNKLDTFLEKN